MTLTLFRYEITLRWPIIFTYEQIYDGHVAVFVKPVEVIRPLKKSIVGKTNSEVEPATFDDIPF